MDPFTASSTEETQVLDEPLDAIPLLSNYVRVILVCIVLGLVGVFSIALWLDPYEADGVPRTMGTHQQMGLPPCTFLSVTGLPCPSCGMTTSFSFFIRGDIVNSMKANAVGTLLAAFGLLLIPWCLACVILRRPIFLRSPEWIVAIGTLTLLGLMMLRWAVVVILALW